MNEITRGDAATFCQGWDDADRARVRIEMERLGAETFVAPPSRAYVICKDAEGETVMWLNPGRIDYPTALAPRTALPLHWKGVAEGSLRALPLSLGHPNTWGLGKLRSVS